MQKQDYDVDAVYTLESRSKIVRLLAYQCVMWFESGDSSYKEGHFDEHDVDRIHILVDKTTEKAKIHEQWVWIHDQKWIKREEWNLEAGGDTYKHFSFMHTYGPLSKQVTTQYL